MLSLTKDLVFFSQWRWKSGMRELEGQECLPDLVDYATAGLLLKMLDDAGTFSDVVKHGDEWIVAVDLSEGLSGYSAGTLGEAAAWALMATWQEENDSLTQ